MKYWQIFNLAIAKVDSQTAQFNSLPNYLTTRYTITTNILLLKYYFLIAWLIHTKVIDYMW